MLVTGRIPKVTIEGNVNGLLGEPPLLPLLTRQAWRPGWLSSSILVSSLHTEASATHTLRINDVPYKERQSLCKCHPSLLWLATGAGYPATAPLHRCHHRGHTSLQEGCIFFSFSSWVSDTSHMAAAHLVLCETDAH